MSAAAANLGTEKSPAAAGPTAARSRRAARRQRVLARLAADPALTHAYNVDPDADPDHVIVTIGLRGVATAELSIDRGRYDEARLLELLVAQHGPPLPLEPMAEPSGCDLGLPCPETHA